MSSSSNEIPVGFQVMSENDISALEKGEYFSLCASCTKENGKMRDPFCRQGISVIKYEARAPGFHPKLLFMEEMNTALVCCSLMQRCGNIDPKNYVDQFHKNPPSTLAKLEYPNAEAFLTYIEISPLGFIDEAFMLNHMPLFRKINSDKIRLLEAFDRKTAEKSFHLIIASKMQDYASIILPTHTNK